MLSNCTDAICESTSIFSKAKTKPLLGVLAVIGVLVPVLNLLLPAVMCTSVLHLVRRSGNGANVNADPSPTLNSCNEGDILVN